MDLIAPDLHAVFTKLSFHENEFACNGVHFEHFRKRLRPDTGLQINPELQDQQFFSESFDLNKRIELQSVWMFRPIYDASAHSIQPYVPSKGVDLHIGENDAQTILEIRLLSTAQACPIVLLNVDEVIKRLERDPALHQALTVPVIVESQNVQQRIYDSSIGLS